MQENAESVIYVQDNTKFKFLNLFANYNTSSLFNDMTGQTAQVFSREIKSERINER